MRIVYDLANVVDLCLESKMERYLARFLDRAVSAKGIVDEASRGKESVV